MKKEIKDYLKSKFTGILARGKWDKDDIEDVLELVEQEKANAFEDGKRLIINSNIKDMDKREKEILEKTEKWVSDGFKDFLEYWNYSQQEREKWLDLLRQIFVNFWWEKFKIDKSKVGKNKEVK